MNISRQIDFSEQMSLSTQMDEKYKLDYAKIIVENDYDQDEKIPNQTNETNEKYTDEKIPNQTNQINEKYEKYTDEKIKSKIYGNILSYQSLIFNGCIVIMGIYFLSKKLNNLR